MDHRQSRIACVATTAWQAGCRRHLRSRWPLGGRLYGREGTSQCAYAEPLRIWQDALRYSPDSEYVQNNVGMSLVELGRLCEAIPHFEAAVRLKPDSAKSYMHLGFALLAAASARSGRTIPPCRRTRSAVVQCERQLWFCPHASRPTPGGDSLPRTGDGTGSQCSRTIA